MGYVEKENRKKYLITGFILMLILGFFGDALLLERGSSSETAINGLLNMGILYIICMTLMAINNATIASVPLNMLFTCSESWAFGFSFLCIFMAIKREEN